ncbi:MAG: septum site-determining protein MinC [Gammaproteobacteria bacterium]|nr:septum site-determining protein MinC [Gammaproteobacteria bacterium]
MSQARASNPVLEFKGRLMTLTILRLLDSSVEVLARELDRRVKEAPAFFRHLPVIIDVGEVASSDLHEDLPGLVELLRTRDLVPVAIRGGDARWAEAADAAGLSVYAAERDPVARRQAPVEDDAAPAAAAAPASTAEPVVERTGGLVVTQPVRSGQQIYARGGDLVLLAQVSPGAEVLADGHIHCYGTLNGRALAGVRGDTEARIFCQSFRADLVSIAGIYSISEQFDEALTGKPVSVSLHGDTLRIERL